MQETPRKNSKGGYIALMFLKIGHRGACGYEPENTLRSFQKALELRVDMIELDVHRCASGEIVVIHDNRVDRTTNGTGYVAEMSLEELRKLDAGEGEKIPLLGEVFDLVKGRAQVNVELKGSGTARPVHDLLKGLVQGGSWSYDDFLVSSFNHYELLEFLRYNANIRIGALTEGIPLGYAEFAERLHASSVNISLEFICKEFVDDAHRRGMKVFVYTVNDPGDIDLVKSLGADGAFSNFPDRL
jgi:glycerophosphoryl diester phosphodiesterase